MNYIFKLDVRVYDKESLYGRALNIAVRDLGGGMSVFDAMKLLRPDDEVDVEACLGMILDPGQIDGCSVDGHEVEHYYAGFGNQGYDV